MTYVVQGPCINCKYGECANVCPRNCFYEGPDMLYINPIECIDCAACVSACPVSAIVPEDEAATKWIRKNADFPFSETTRRYQSDDVTHGPDWKPQG